MLTKYKIFNMFVTYKKYMHLKTRYFPTFYIYIYTRTHSLSSFWGSNGLIENLIVRFIVKESLSARPTENRQISKLSANLTSTTNNNNNKMFRYKPDLRERQPDLQFYLAPFGEFLLHFSVRAVFYHNHVKAILKKSIFFSFPTT